MSYFCRTIPHHSKVMVFERHPLLRKEKEDVKRDLNDECYQSSYTLRVSISYTSQNPTHHTQT
jgi:hypothetical protein